MMSSAIFFSYSSQRDFNSILDNLEKYKVDQIVGEKEQEQNGDKKGFRARFPSGKNEKNHEINRNKYICKERWKSREAKICHQDLPCQSICNENPVKGGNSP